MLTQATVLPLTITSVILFRLLKLGGAENHVQEFLLPLGWVRTEVFVECHGLVEARGVTVSDDVDQVLVGHLSIDIKSIDIFLVFLYNTRLLGITYLVKRPLQLIVVAIVFSNGSREFAPSIESMLVRLPPFQRISFRTYANLGQLLYLVAGLCDGEVIIHLKIPSF